MPVYRDPFTKGRLIVKFSVKFPSPGSIPIAKIGDLESALPPREEIIVPDDAEERTLEEYDPYENGNNRRRGREVYDEDDDDGPHGQRVQCASH